MRIPPSVSEKLARTTISLRGVLSDWVRGLERLRRHFGGGTGPMPSALVERAEALFAELIPSQAERRRCCMAIYTTSTSWPLDANRGWRSTRRESWASRPTIVVRCCINWPSSSVWTAHACAGGA